MLGNAGRKIPFAFTAFPNSLLDLVMPLLRDTEWRVLCVVVRRTVNFRQNTKAGAPTWITRTQLLAATGRDSEAVSRAVDALVQRRLLAVRDEAGQPLDSPAQRRAARGKQLLALHPQLLRSIGLSSQGTRDGQESPAPDARKIEHSSREEENAKSNTLKERAMKKQLSPALRTDLQAAAGEVFGIGNAVPDHAPPQGEQLSFADWSQDAHLGEFFALYQARYNSRFGRQAPQTSLTASQADQLRQRWTEEGAGKIEELLDFFFTLDWLWVKSQHYSPGAFASSFNLVRLTYNKKFRSPSPRSTRPATRPSPEPRSYP